MVGGKTFDERRVEDFRLLVTLRPFMDLPTSIIDRRGEEGAEAIAGLTFVPKL